MATKHIARIMVVLHKPRTVLAIISLAQAIEAAISAHTTTFPSPTPGMAQFKSDLDALAVAQNAASARTKGAVQTRDAALAVVDTDLNSLRGYVETVANADPANAAAIATGGGMEVRKARAPSNKNDVNVKAGKVSGSLVVTARVGTKQKQSHEWQYSVDGGKTWTTLPPTTQAKTTITGLNPGVSVIVQHRAVTGTGPTNWSLAQPLLVV